jgi:L-seryl-tRNA(Ser) seleniumtransferase
VSDRRDIPSVDVLLQSRQAAAMVAEYGRPLTLEALRSVLGQIRSQHKEGETLPDRTSILHQTRETLETWLQPTLLPVINATGVILHTNLGRAPLSAAALQAINQLSGGYCTLEYELGKGVRGSRAVHAETLLTRLTGAEAALVVNNNAAAVLLALSALAVRKRVIISRTQLVEIGGGFRVPDVMSQSGARLVEIGTTNRVHVSDYEAALQEPTALILRAHHSNFKLIGFTSEPTMDELVAVGKKHATPVMDDLGSGALLDTARFGLAHEPTVQESVAAGVDLVCFSGDKLLGGPQAGILVGRKDLIAKIKKHPLARAVRADKLCLAALSATLHHYLKDEAEREVPIWRMISATPQNCQVRAQYWAETLKQGEVVASFSTVGGGSLPEETLPTFVLALRTAQPNKFLAILRGMHPPLIGRVEAEQVMLDPRTVLPEQEGALLVNLKNALGKGI